MRNSRRRSAPSAGPIRTPLPMLLLALALGPGSAAAQDATLVVDALDGADYGYRYNGVFDHRERADFAFEGTNVPLSLSLTVFDIDDATELEARVNGSSIGFLPSTPNDGTGTAVLDIPVAVQQGGTNTLSFVQRVPGWKWGVTDLLLAEGTSEPPGPPALAVGVTDAADYGYRYNGVFDHRERADFAFEGTSVPLSLSLTVFDVDDATELEARVNGSSIGFLPTTPNDGTGTAVLDIPVALQQGGTNTLSFIQRVPGWKWGVTDLFLAEDDPSSEPPAASLPDLDDYDLVFADDFDGNALDPDTWYTGLLWGPYLPINNEQQLYVDTLGMHASLAGSPSDPFEVSGGTLKIRATPTGPSLQPPPRPPEGDPAYSREFSEYRYNGPVGTPGEPGYSPGYSPDDVDYLSGIITSYKSFKTTHGYVEARLKLPPGRGLWPAFWMLPTHYVEDVPEIDVMEFLGQDVDRVYHTYHYFDTTNDWQLFSTPSYPTFATDWTADFHTFGMSWTPGKIVWYVDGEKVREITDGEFRIANQAMYLIANLAVGGNWPGPPDASTPFPATLEIDYIRAYKRKEAEPLNLSADYRIVFRDEFDGSSLDPDKWNTHFLWGPYLPINDEQQYYVDALGSDSDLGYSPFTVANGHLTITARAAEDPAGVEPPAQLPGPNEPIWTDYPNFRQHSEYLPPDFTSGIITSYDAFKFAHGYAEIRARLPEGKGLWPAFWLLNGYYVGQSPEIDVLELRGERPREVTHAYHRYAPGGVLNSDVFETVGGDPIEGYADDFHTFGVRWRPGRIEWYIDRQRVQTYTGDDVAYQVMYVIANLAVGGTFPAVPDDPAAFPAEYVIDYIRVYQIEDPP